MTQTTTQSPPKWLGIAIAIVALALLLSLAALAVLSFVSDRTATDSALWEPEPGLETTRVPDFRLIDQDGNPVDHAALDGRITILDFIFTHCPLYCPAMSARMMYLNNYLEGTGVQFLSISIDPENDTPERLREFAARYEADHDRWTFLTGEPAEIARIGDEMGFAIRANEEDRIPTADGGTMANLIHPTSLLLVGPDRRVLGRYGYQFDEEIDALAERAAKLANALD